MNGIRDLIHEIHRRSIWQVLGIYLVGAWIALQVVDVIGDNYGLPDWFPGFALALLVIGLPIVLATAFVQEGVGGRGGASAAAARSAGDADVAAPTEAPAEALGTAGAPASPPRQSDASEPPPALHRLLTWRNAIAGGLLAFGLWGVVATFVLISGRGASAAGGSGGNPDGENPLHTVAVLPFDNLSPDPDNAFFADGVHEDVLTHLSKMSALTVISRTSVLAYRETDLSMGEIGAELGVGAIVEGSVRRAGDEVRITAQLIDARNDEHLWADNFDRQLSAASVFALQTEIAQRIADALAATLTPEEEERIARNPTESLDALDFYLRGRSVYGRYTQADNEEAVRLFREAIAVDPEYPDAWAGLSDAYGQRAFQFGLGREWADSAELTALRSLELDPELATGYKALALAYTAQFRVTDSYEANLRAVELDPNLLAAVGNVGVHYWSIGRHDEALRWIKRAGRLDPASARASYHVALNWLAVGELERSEAEARRVLRLDPRDLYMQDVLCWIAQLRGNPESEECDDAHSIGLRDDAEARLFRTGSLYLARDFEAAARLARQVEAEAPEINTFHHIRTLLGLSLALSGDAEGERILREQRRRFLDASEGEATFPLEQLGAIDAYLGDTEAALDWLEAAREIGRPPIRGRTLDPAYDSVRDHPRWIAMMEVWDADLEAQRQRMLAEWGDGS